MSERDLICRAVMSWPATSRKLPSRSSFSRQRWNDSAYRKTFSSSHTTKPELKEELAAARARIAELEAPGD
jgi:hypothetical protein